MSAKKSSDAPVVRTILGRSRNNVEMGILGLPNVGKSSFFNVLCKMSVPAENFPFCTIDPSTAKVAVPDKRWRYLCEVYKPKSEVPAALTVTDIAGLVRGASEGAGLGNEFLSHIGGVDALYHMVRGFEDEEIVHVEPGPIDPVRDIEIILNELRAKDLAHCDKFIASNEKNVERKVGGKELAAEFEVVKQVRAMLAGDKEAGILPKDVRAAEWNPKDIDILNKHLFLTSKPMVFLVNLSKKNYIKKTSKFLPKIAEYVKNLGCGEQVIPFSVTFEQELLEAEENNGRDAYLAECEGAISMLPRIIHAGYEALDLIHYFTAGEDEVKCWTIRKGTLAPAAAGVIHTDFQKNFIQAEITPFKDFKEHGSEVKCKEAGKTRSQGKTYVMQDGDIAFFKIGKN
jgi:obg-like ATPase 1